MVGGGGGGGGGLARRGSTIGFSFTLAYSRISHVYSLIFVYYSD